ncbi:MAG TPA: hypothetical protein VMB74_17220 [Streptosporangiaceae bacterium]|nr:hypothetical protein [Streptosporangiaceae bacterium]
MIKLAWRRAAIVLAAGSTLALAGALLPAQAATTGWRTDATFVVRGSENIYTSVAASGRSDAWAAGFAVKPSGKSWQTEIRHWTGKAWRAVALPAKIAKTWNKEDPVLPEVGVASARDVWVFGGFAGSYLRLNGSKWTIGRLPGGSASAGALIQIDAVKVFSSTNVWALGERDVFSSTQEVTAAYAAHYNGRKWSRVSAPGTGGITAVAAASSSTIWAVESTQSNEGLAMPAAARPVVTRARAAAAAATPPVVLQWTASTGWQQAADQPSLATSDQLTSVVAEPDGDVWLGGSADNSAKGTSPLTAEWNGTSWSVSDLPGKATSADLQLLTMAPDGTGGIWALALNGSTGAERIWQLHGATWSQAKPAFGKRAWVLTALALVPGTHSVWGAGAVEATKSTADGLIAVDGALPR